MPRNTARRAPILLLAVSCCVCVPCGAHTRALAGDEPTAAPIITTVAGLNGAVIVTLSSASAGAAVYYTVDGSTPTVKSTPYEAPFLVSSNLTLRAVAQARGDAVSRVTMRKFHPNIPSGTLVWSEEFNEA